MSAAPAKSSSEAPEKPFAMNTPRAASNTASSLNSRGRPRGAFSFFVPFRIKSVDELSNAYLCTVSHINRRLTNGSLCLADGLLAGLPHHGAGGGPARHHPLREYRDEDDGRWPRL